MHEVSENEPFGISSHETNLTSTSLVQPGVLVAKRHHILVRCSHWLNMPLLLGLILSGISIYWSSPIYQHKPDPVTGNFFMSLKKEDPESAQLAWADFVERHWSYLLGICKKSYGRSLGDLGVEESICRTRLAGSELSHGT